jgi:hypothetical protein
VAMPSGIDSRLPVIWTGSWELPHLIDQGIEPLAGFYSGHGCHGRCFPAPRADRRVGGSQRLPS